MTGGDLGSVVVDGDTPDITGCAATAGTYGIGDAIDITCTFDQAVDVTGTPQITLSNSKVVGYTSGTGSANLVFRYTVSEGDTDSAALDVSSIAANGGTIQDAADNDFDTTMAGGDLGSVVVDGDTPDITGCAATAGTYKIGDAIDITCTFDSAVDVTGTPQITLSNSAVVGYTSGTGSADLLFRYTVVEDQTDSAALDVSSIAANGGSIQDAA
ncbi:MAG: hypothetical protein GY900_14155, partial [Actinomycetia bacterium]|nr:hypothetical protein [Actinomycetes bacterium]